MSKTYATHCHDLAVFLIGDMPGCTPEDIARLAGDFQDAVQDAADAIEEREADRAADQ
jgi:CTP:molybdopterin cytidylyltransferase MocA